MPLTDDHENMHVRADEARRYLKRRRAVITCVLVAVVAVGTARAISLAPLAELLRDRRACHHDGFDDELRGVDADGHAAHAAHGIHRVVATGLTPLAVHSDRPARKGPVAIAVCGDEGTAFTLALEGAR